MATQTGAAKDTWDRFAITSTAVSGMLIAAIGGLFTLCFNQRQAVEVAEAARRQSELREHDQRVAEVQTVAAFMPALTSGDKLKIEGALIAISELGNVSLATKLAKLYAGDGGIDALARIGKNGDPHEKQTAAGALASIAATSSGEEGTRAQAALRAIGPMIISIKRRTPLTLTIEAVGTASFVLAAVDDRRVQPGESFVLSSSPGRIHLINVTVIFSENSAENAHYTVQLNGSGSTEKPSFVIRRDVTRSTPYRESVVMLLEEE